jgi:thiamine biosynthesis lipoprotein
MPASVRRTAGIPHPASPAPGLMSGGVVPAGWIGVRVGAAAIAERDALGTSARVAAWPPCGLAAVLAAVDAELDRLDRQASRFRADSEVSRIHRAPGPVHRVSDGLAEAIRVALAAAQWTGGLTDPTVGAALIALGYDRDFAAIGPGMPPPPAGPDPVPGWRSVRLHGTALRLPAGTVLDLGATGKGLGSDRAATAAGRACGQGGVLVSLGGDIMVDGLPPRGGWPVAVADSCDLGGGTPADTVGGLAGNPGGGPPGQLVRLAAGGLATSSVTCRQWQRDGQPVHHIIDPRTGSPAYGPWRTVSVAAASCAEANAAATAAIVAGTDAERWLARTGLPARLVSHHGIVRLLGGWPRSDGGQLPGPLPSQWPGFGEKKRDHD